MKKWLRHRQFLVLLLAACSACGNAQVSAAASQSVFMAQYSVTIAPSDQPGAPPQLKLEREHQTVFQVPIVAGVASPSSEEHLSEISYSLRKSGEDTFELKRRSKKQFVDRPPISVAILLRPH